MIDGDEEVVPELVELQQEQAKEPINLNPNASSSDKKIPLTIITGYLGSGKTTLMNYILNENHGKRIAVILNDFGDAYGVDKTRILQSSTNNNEPAVFEEWLELRNGCICCSVKDVGVQMIENLVAKKGSYDYILLETNGLADPGALVSLFWVDDELQSQVQLDGMVTVIDGKHFLERLAEAEKKEKEEVGMVTELTKQIAAADRIILNKIDLLTKEKSSQIEEKLNMLNPSAVLAKTIHCNINLDFILGIGAYDFSKQTEEDCLRIEEKIQTFKESKHQADPEVKTICVVLKRNEKVSLKLFENWLQSLLWEKTLPGVPEIFEPIFNVEIIRMKGFVNVYGSKERVVYQGVCETFDKHVTGKWESDSQRETRLIFIGKKLDTILFQKSLRNHCVEK